MTKTDVSSPILVVNEAWCDAADPAAAAMAKVLMLLVVLEWLALQSAAAVWSPTSSLGDDC